MLPNGMTVAVTLKAFDEMSKVVAAATGNAASRFKALGSRVSEVSAQMRSVGTGLAGAGLAMGASLAIPVKQAMDFEVAMTGLGKQAGVTRDQMGLMTSEGKKRYAELTDEVFKLGSAMPMAHADIAGMMEAGARMGVDSKQLASFTRTAAMMASAFDAVPAELAEQMAKISNVMGIPIEKIGGLADVINYLDDQAVAKGSDIINVLQRVGASAKFVNMTGSQVSALATTFLSMGTAPEVAATGINAVIMKLAAATKGSKNFAAGLKSLGLDAKAVQEGMFKDAQGTILKVLNSVKALPQTKQIAVLTDLFGMEYADDVAKLAGGLKEYAKIRDLAVSPNAQGSMQAEFNARLQQTSSQLMLTGNSLHRLSVTLGTLFLPYVKQGLEFVTPLINRMTEWINANPKLTTQLGLAAAAIAGVMTVGGGLLVVLGTIGGGLGLAIGGLGNLAAAGSKVAGWTGDAAAGLAKFGGWVGALPARLAGLNARMAAAVAGWGPAISAALSRAGFAFASFRIQAALSVGVMRGWAAAQLAGARASLSSAAASFAATGGLAGLRLRLALAVGTLRAYAVAQLGAFRSTFLTAGGLQALGGSVLARVVTGLRGAMVAARAFSLALLANPLGLVAVAVGVAAFAVYKYWRPISGFFRGLWRGFVEGLGPISKAVGPAFAKMAAAVAPVLGPIRAVGQWLMNLLKPVDDVGGGAEKMGRRFGLVLAGMVNAIGGLANKMAIGAANMMTSLANGIASGASKVYAQMQKVAAGVRAYWPFSPAKAGPLRDIHRIKLVETIAAGVRPAPLVKAMTQVAGAARAAAVPAVRGALSPAVAGAAARGGGTSIHFAPTIDARGAAAGVEADIKAQLAGMKHELVKMVKDAQASRDRSKFGG